ncbi:MAG TPA: hypothetical protein VGM84_13190 [Steroidobacteraceae bacterium]|jgi:hypothetical protein
MQVIVDRSERLALEEQERERTRAQHYEELRSEFNSAAVRLRAWEKLHGLRLPTSSNHPILRVISAATGVPVAAIRDEQQARRDARAGRPATDEVGATITAEVST